VWKRCSPVHYSALSCTQLIRNLQFIGLLGLLLLGLAPAAEEKRLAVYSPQTSFNIPIFDHDGREYVSVTDLLDPFGRATLAPDKKRWRLKLVMANGSSTDGEFTENSSQAKLRGKKISLASPYWADNSRGYIPISSAHIVLSQLLGLSANLRENSRRLFVGDVASSYSAELQKGNPSKLVLHFVTPVNPTISTEPGRVRLSFNREPLVSNQNNPQALDDPILHSATFSESNGTAEIVVATSAPVIASFSDNGKTITLAPAPTPVAQASPPQSTTGTPSPTATTPTPTAPAPTTTSPVPPRFLVMIDPAHGGNDPGAALGDGLFEKDVTLAIARRIRNDLDQRGIAAVLLRDGDASLTVDQRAAAANASRAGMYIAIHADTLGTGVRLYSARLTPQPTTVGFVPWNSAQSPYLDQSHDLIASMMAEFDSRHVRAVLLESGLRPLRNVTKPAIAVEIAPPQVTRDGITSAVYQQSVASAVAAGIANLRKASEAGR
jgi:N-acetylmuramoyl-L-alanine amidase